MQQLSNGWLIVSNFVVSAAWARVFLLLVTHRQALLSDDTNSDEVCEDILLDAVHLALYLSAVELFNALIGLTRSKPTQVFTFNAVRMGVAFWISPKLPCSCWQALMTIACWSFGDTIRFGCFGMDMLLPGGRMAKSIRYTVAPLIFPFGALGEMLMVVRIGTVPAYLFSMLWPVGFYPLMTQLLKQKHKHFHPPSQKKVIKSV